MRNLWYVNKVKCEGYFDQRIDSDSGRILKTTYFKLTNCTFISGIKLSFFLSFRCEKQGIETRIRELEQLSFICKDLCQTNLWRVNCDQAQKYSSHSTADTRQIRDFIQPLIFLCFWRRCQLQKVIEHQRYVNKWVLRIGGMAVTGTDTSTRRKTYPGATLSTGYPT